ncbi:MAG: hypothetical protein Dasosvirus18_1 [Dasosvirus sp.]|uniref:Uncharacterized protein n=1 Tax=Dasosvirus sp. TaxID=2487764 RepID=A0A3G4ZRV0_9VIRU|nr:MAG: hypothetical protein Dasosvirus18_1 [Dasosvirus sp.]
MFISGDILITSSSCWKQFLYKLTVTPFDTYTILAPLETSVLINISFCKRTAKNNGVFPFLSLILGLAPCFTKSATIFSSIW